MILDNHYAVVFKASRKKTAGNGAIIQDGYGPEEQMVLTAKGWEQLQIMARDGVFVILEAWDITKGKCVSN